MQKRMERSMKHNYKDGSHTMDVIDIEEEMEADRIMNLSSVRGTAMHKYLESHITDIGYEDLTDTGKENLITGTLQPA